MKITTEEWNNFTPGIRMYKGEKTFFYNGEDDLYMPCDCWESDWPEEFFRDILSDGSPNMFWKGVSFDSVDNIEVSNTDNIKVIIVLPGVEVIYEKSFYLWKN
ncbi:predicted protein [Chaetoceros tenuissimus]|uniref:Uncharacterized protein n=1 Tax=Chaetoceros tenuissimus TaxID=426638 RepID=A0AAD3HAW4_9STRA|nr:predicted protein [Chaetoceros tenuissimus]